MKLLNRAVAMGLAVVALGSASLVVSEAALAQRPNQGVNGYNVSEVQFNGGHFRKTGRRQWTEYGVDGRAKFTFNETGRDDWSVYLNDPSRNMRLQIDIHRNWIRLGENGGPMRDFYPIASAYQNEGRTRSRDGASRGMTDGQNVRQVFFPGGSFKQTGPGRWTEFNDQGQAMFRFVETGRDQWSVYLDDRARNIQLQLDLYRKWVGYGQNGGAKSDLYRITSTSRQRTASRPRSRPSPPSASRTRDVNAGPIWNQQDARTKCPAVAASQGGEWTGQWRTTVQGKMSVCEIRY